MGLVPYWSTYTVYIPEQVPVTGTEGVLPNAERAMVLAEGPPYKMVSPATFRIIVIQ